MTDIPEEFQDVPRLPNGKPDFRTKRGKELKAWLHRKENEAQNLVNVDSTGRQHAYDPGSGHMATAAAPMDGGGTEEAGDERFHQAPQEPVQATATAAAPSATPMPSLGTHPAAQHLLALIAREWPEAKWMNWNNVSSTLVAARGHVATWRKLTQGR